jgi:hypothetical protein
MSWNNEIAENIKKLAGTLHLKDKPDLYYATVNTDSPYDVAARTCNVTLISGRSGINITSASLMPEVNDGLLILPSPGSTVVIAKVANGNPFVFMFSQIDQLIYITGDTLQLCQGGTSDDIGINITLKEKMLNIKNANQDFTKIMQNILTHMQNVVTHITALTVSTGTGPSGVPINLSDFSNDLTDLNTDLSNLNEILN